MPRYTVEHAVPLTDAQQDDLAEAITSIHSTLLTTPRSFVQVKYVDTSKQVFYTAGKRRAGNHINGIVRTGGSRTIADFEKLAGEIAAAWDRIVPLPVAKTKMVAGAGNEDTTLGSCVILGGILTGFEDGFFVPQAGREAEWLKENWAEMTRRAEAGDEHWQEVVADVKSRGLQDANGKTAQQKLEEALGWGDSA